MATREDCIQAAVSSGLSEEDAAGIVDYNPARTAKAG